MNPDWHGFDPAELSLRFTVYTSGVTTAIIGSANIDHVKQHITSVEKGPLPIEVMDYFNQLFIQNEENWVGLI